MMKFMRKFFKRLALVILSVILIVVVYSIFDNNRIKVVEQQIVIDDLPEEFEGFKILQIADLHGKTFGKDQKRLLKLMNSIDYDMIAICGDMVDRHTEDNEPFFDILNGLDNKENIFYLKGDTGLEAINESTGEITSDGQLLMEKECKILDEPYAITKGDSILWVSRFITGTEFYQQTGVDKDNDNSVKVVVTHYPRHKYHYTADRDTPGYDLVLAGHYHAGQYRIPFYGALFIPDVFTPVYLFPDQREVKGLITWGNTNQYVTAGLGANARIKLLEFRLFNTPEINVITLTKK
ncbi:MAG: hypothetical protein MSA56_01610 [Clostridium sp.]|nr:hypothetical protein [Clostridium sp.]